MTQPYQLLTRCQHFLRRRYNAAMARVARKLRTVSCKSDWLSAAYYFLGSRSFRREQRSVLAGLVEYEKRVHSPNQSSSLLRRNIHGLEKGLLMRPRRDVFATDYILDTVLCYEKVYKNGESTSEVSWAHDVLKEYFEIVRPHPVVDKARELFESVPSPHASTGNNKTPYVRDLDQPTPVDFSALQSLSMRRRSVRWFEQRPVSRDEIDKAVSLAGQSPSACNRQPFCFLICDTSKDAATVAAMAMGTAGYSENIPALIVVVGRLCDYFSERDRHLIYIDASLAVMSLVYALETLGIGSVCINWPDIDERERKIQETLNLRPYERVIMLLGIGYPARDGKVAYSEKKPLEQLRSYIQL